MHLFLYGIRGGKEQVRNFARRAQVPPNYDSLLGKLIVWGEDRNQAIARMHRALNELVISGVPTTTIYHTMILQIDDFVNGIVDTGFIPKHQAELSEPPPPREVSFDGLSLSWCSFMTSRDLMAVSHSKSCFCGHALLFKF